MNTRGKLAVLFGGLVFLGLVLIGSSQQVALTTQVLAAQTWRTTYV